MTDEKRQEILTKAREFLKRADVRREMEADLGALVAIPSVASAPVAGYPYGVSCADALRKALAIGERMGFATVNHDFHCGSILHGDHKKEVGIVAHLDVVPAGGNWSQEPYKLVVKDDRYVGRGVLDDKGPFIAGLYAMRFLKEAGVELPFSVRLIAGSDEEVGSSDLEYFAKVCEPPAFSFTPDAEFPVCIGEKGILQINVMLGRLPGCIDQISGGSVSNAVADSASAIIWQDGEGVPTEHELSWFSQRTNLSFERLDAKRLRVTATGKSAHAAMPEEGVNAIGILAAYLAGLGSLVCEKKSFEFLAKACSEYKGVTLGINKEDPAFDYLTCVGGKLYAKDGILIQNFNIRYIPDTPLEEILENIKKAILPLGYALEVQMHSEGYALSENDSRVAALTDACEEILGYPCKPYTMGGGTYARWLANTVAFGPSIDADRKIDDPTRGGPHQPDEFFMKSEMDKSILIYILSILNLAESGV